MDRSLKYRDLHVIQRDEIISAIQRLAKASGQAPGQKLFRAETGIGERAWRGLYWSRWSDALRDAGLEPNQLTQKFDTDEVLDGVIAACRALERLPTGADLQLLRRSDPAFPHPNVVKTHFGRRDDLIAALAMRAANHQAYADIVSFLPPVAPNAATSRGTTKAVDGYVYLIKSGDFYKVGRSDDAERRFKQISIALPDKAELFHTITTDDPSGIEAYWHRRFAERRANGEWFKLTAADIAAFRRRKFQ